MTLFININPKDFGMYLLLDWEMMVIMHVLHNTKIEINPFYSGFNVFKVTFTDAAGKPYTKVSTTEIVFGNTAADISNVVANLQKIGPGVFSVTGAYISQPAEWDIALSAQRVQDLDLNYAFTAKVTNAPSTPPKCLTLPS